MKEGKSENTVLIGREIAVEMQGKSDGRRGNSQAVWEKKNYSLANTISFFQLTNSTLSGLNHRPCPPIHASVSQPCIQLLNFFPKLYFHFDNHPLVSNTLWICLHSLIANFSAPNFYRNTHIKLMFFIHSSLSIIFFQL